MTSKNFNVVRYDADEGKVFDWAVEHKDVDEEGNERINHLYSKTLFVAPNDDINNYVEVDAPIAE